MKSQSLTRSIRPFPIHSLPEYATSEVTLLNALLPQIQAADVNHIIVLFSQTLQKYLGTSVALTYTGLSTLHAYRAAVSSPSDAEPKASDNPPRSAADKIGVRLVLPHTGQAICLVLPLLWVRQAVESILGGDGELPHTALPLSPVEEGVLEFLILKFLQALHRLGSESADARSRPYYLWHYERLMSGHDVLAVSEPKQVAPWVASFTLESGGHAAVISLVFDGAAWLGEFRKHRLADAADTANAHKLCHHVPLVADVAIGTVSLLPHELSALESGDILLFDETAATLTGVELGGIAHLRLDRLPGWVFEMRINQRRLRTSPAGKSPAYTLTMTDLVEERQDGC